MLCCFNVNADYFNYLVWSLLSEYSILTTASQVSCCVQRYVTIAFQHVFVLSITLPQWVSVGNGSRCSPGQRTEKSETRVICCAVSAEQTSRWQPATNARPSGHRSAAICTGGLINPTDARHAATRRPTSLWSQSNHQNVAPQQPAVYVQSF